MVEAISVLNLNPMHLDMSQLQMDAQTSSRSNTSVSSLSISESSEIISPRAEEILRMQAELRATRNQLAEKDKKMTEIQVTVDAEVQELTEKLFQEAYKMVNSAEARREKSEKLLNESRMEVDLLRAEVLALKEVVKNSGSNYYKSTSPESALSKMFSSKNSSKSRSLPSTSVSQSQNQNLAQKEADSVEEIDPILFKEFEAWKQSGHPMQKHPFIDRVMVEEIEPCMLFENTPLAIEIMKSIQMNRIQIEPINEAKPSIRNCSLTNVQRFCPYRIRTSEEQNDWNYISLIARNRIAAVCDFYTCIRYLSQGLIKPGLRDAYFHVVNLRKNMSLAKLGLGFVPRSNIRHNQ
ncbi:unnamed protein product [Caenorhabditis angaria]|uniref:GDP/GTP exchange factor Sec2 N-terminal domain-containing protein n=1 Tax=Caenorhabditis angaria TaxID=860376 RepID=A0A9P1I9H4_9PELO|nr:unnamed protein product [Caenorhabditis angaria]